MKEDQDKVSFVTVDNTFCYVVMSFGLKNVGTTYQSLMNKVFAEHVRRNVEVYVDDILDKSLLVKSFVPDFKEIVATIKGYGMNLNPKNCLFWVIWG